MTEYGESVTQKEILIDSYLVVPEFSADSSEKINTLENINTEWTIESPHNHLLKFREFYFFHTVINEPSILQNRLSSSGDFVIMQFCLSGNCTFSTKNNKKSISFRSSEYNILCIPQNQDLFFSYEDNTLEIVSIYFEKNFLLKYIPANHHLINKINSKNFGVVCADNLSVSPKIQSVIQDIINCGFEGHLKNLFTQAKVIELLTLQLAQIEEEKTSSVPLKQSDIEKMIVVKDIIHNSYNESFSLSYLARAAGTNEQYLKKHFKILFGSTVFNYILACKMEKAKELLLQGEYKIADVAEITGYKHATHFTSAFKKFFGYIPQKIKGKLEALVISVKYFEFLELIEIIQF